MSLKYKKINAIPYVESDINKMTFNIFGLIKKNWAFILFSFVNAFLPIIICIIAATIKKTGTENMLAISFSSPFQLVFLNIPFILTFWFICFVAKISRDYNSKNYSFKDMFWIILVFNTIVGLCLSLLFYISSFLYVHFFYLGTNATEIAKEGELFIGLFTPIIFINCIGYVFIFLIFFKFGSGRIAILEILRLLFIILFSLVFSCFTDLGVIGIGIGILIGSLLSLLINFTICFKFFEMRKYKYSFDFNWVKYAIKNSWKIVLVKIFASLVKPLIFFVMGAHKNTQDPNFMIAKSIWYFVLYFITFFSDGISKIFMFHKIIYFNNYRLTKESYKSINILFFINFIILVLLSIGSYFILKPLGEFLILNKNSLENIPEFGKINIIDISEKILLPSSLAILFTLFYCIFNSVNQLITDIKPMFEVKKEEKLVITLVIILIVIGIILGVGLLLMNQPIVGGLTAFTVPMFIISFLFALGGLIGWLKFRRKNKFLIK